MLTKIATRITNRLLLHRAITDEMTDIYIYGFELLISFLFSTTVIIAFGLVLNALLPTLAFLIIFITLRGFTGGFHAKTYLMCSIVTFSVYGIVMILSRFISVPRLSYFFLEIMFLFCNSKQNSSYFFSFLLKKQ